MVTLKAQCCRRILSEAIKQTVAQSWQTSKHNAKYLIPNFGCTNINQIYNQRSMFNQIPYSLQSSVPDALRFYLLIKQPYLFNTSTSYESRSITSKEGKEWRKKKTQKGWEKQWPSRIFQFSSLLKASLIPHSGLYRPLAQQLGLEYYHETRSWVIIVHLTAYSKLT